MRKSNFLILAITLFALTAVINQTQAVDHTTPIALPNLGTDTYLGFEGGLYPNGSNSIPAAYMSEVQAAYDALSADSSINFLCIGMSNLEQTCDHMIENIDGRMNPNVTVGNGGRPGRAMQAWDSGVNSLYTDLRRADMDANQVDVVIFFNACGFPETAYCGDWFSMQNSFESVYNSINQAYPQVKLIYFTSREYAPPEANNLNPNPYAFQDGFSVKWAIESRINGQLSGVPVVWGPYQYDESWPFSYFRVPDYVHLSSEGLSFVGELWYEWFLGEPWFNSGPIPTATPTIEPTATSTPDPNVTPTHTPEPTNTAVPTETPSVEPSPTPCTLVPPIRCNGSPPWMNYFPIGGNG